MYICNIQYAMYYAMLVFYAGIGFVLDCNHDLY